MPTTSSALTPKRPIIRYFRASSLQGTSLLIVIKWDEQENSPERAAPASD